MSTPVPWVAITLATLKDRNAAPLIEALQTSALAVGQTDPTPALITSATARIRAEIASKHSNRQDADLTKIPPSLLDLGCRLVMRAMKARIFRALTPDEITDQRSDERYLERIAEGKVTIETSDNAVTAAVESNSSVVVVRPGNQSFVRDEMRGL